MDLFDRLDLDRIADGINDVWHAYAPAILAAAVVAVALTVAWVLWSLWRRSNTKKIIGFGVVQIGVTYAVITGVYEFFHIRLGMPVGEAIMLAVFIEGAVWGAVGFIVAHGKGRNDSGNPNTGFGDAGGLFWFAQVGGGLLAVIGSPSAAVAVGRVVIVALGAYMWYIQLLQVTRRSGKPTRWRWTPKQLLLALGAIAPEESDIKDEVREWQVQRLARAMRWANSRWPWSWLGGRALAKRAESTTEDVLAAARRRFAAAWVMREESRVDAPTMAAVIAEATAAAKWAAGQPVDIGGASARGVEGTSAAAIGWTPVDIPEGHGRDTQRDTVPSRARGSGRTARRGHAPAVSEDGLSKRQRHVLGLLAQDDPRLSYKEIAQKLGVDRKTIQRDLTEMRQVMEVKSNDQLRDIAAGRPQPPEGDRGVDTPPAGGGDTPAAASGQSPNGHVGIDPGAVADMAATGDRT